MHSWNVLTAWRLKGTCWEWSLRVNTQDEPKINKPWWVTPPRSHHADIAMVGVCTKPPVSCVQWHWRQQCRKPTACPSDICRDNVCWETWTASRSEMHSYLLPTSWRVPLSQAASGKRHVPGLTLWEAESFQKSHSAVGAGGINHKAQCCVVLDHHFCKTVKKIILKNMHKAG